MTPQVQTLAQLMAELQPGSSQQQALIDQQRQGLGAKYGAQKAGLAAEKGEGFNAINNQATGRGLSFSGIPVDEQARYLSTKYLPAVANLDYQQNQEDMGFQKQSADLYSQMYGQAFSRQGQQESNLNSWNMQQNSQQFQAEQNRLSREASAREAAMSRASSAQSQGPTTQQVLDNINGWAKGKTGGDGKLSPSDFKAGYQQFFSFSGGSVDDYTALMQRYVNTSHFKDYTI